MQAAEQWRDAPGYEGAYMVSDRGNVRSLTRVVRHTSPNGRIVKGQPIKTRVAACGYPVVSLRTGAVGTCVEYVHTLVLTAFIGPRPDGQEGLHWDGNKQNNALANLRWGTSAENKEDDRRARGGAHAHCKLNPLDVVRIRKDRRLQREIAAEYGVDQTTVSEIKLRKTWAHVGEPA